jgi:hypothetical protein
MKMQTRDVRDTWVAHIITVLNKLQTLDGPLTSAVQVSAAGSESQIWH